MEPTPPRHSPQSTEFAPHVPGVARFIGGAFGFAFAGIGLTVLGFLWGTPFDEFGSPPLVFRLFGSFIAVVFVVFGGGMLYSVVTGRGLMRGRPQGPAQAGAPPAPSAASAGGYDCPNCGAPLGKGADVSPMGDVKCTFCNTWFNVHGRGGSNPSE